MSAPCFKLQLFPADTSAGTGWANTEFRTYRFKAEDGDDASLEETLASRERRRGTEEPVDETERLRLSEAKQKAAESKHRKKERRLSRVQSRVRAKV
jgi:hypothetical protein